MGRVGVFDIGTVTCRLGVADIDAGHVLRCSKTSTICNLGDGVAQSGCLKDDAIERVLTCLDGYVAKAREADVSAGCCTLTSAARDAKNASVLLEGLRSRGIVPQVIPGEVEGSLTFLGVAQDFPGQRICVADNGGGSTEIAVGVLDTNERLGMNLEAVHSLNVGCRRVTDLYLKRSNPPCAEDIEEACAFCREAFARELPLAAKELADSTRLVCVGGTVTTLVAILSELDPYDSSFVHLHSLSLAEVDACAQRLASVPLETRRTIKGLQPKRAEVILGGALCVSELMRATGAQQLTVSESDLLFGLALATDAANSKDFSPIEWQPQLFSLS